MTFIKDYLEEKEKTFSNNEIAKQLGVSVAMISSYKRQGFYPSLRVAMRVYDLDGVVLHPFSEESLKYELEKEKE